MVYTSKIQILKCDHCGKKSTALNNCEKGDHTLCEECVYSDECYFCKEKEECGPCLEECQDCGVKSCKKCKGIVECDHCFKLQCEKCCDHIKYCEVCRQYKCVNKEKVCNDC